MNIIPFLVLSILIVGPVTLIAWWGVRENENDCHS
jgi:hypothetical protein